MKVQLSEKELASLPTEEIERRITKLATHELAGMPNYCEAILLAEEELERRKSVWVGPTVDEWHEMKSQEVIQKN